MIPKSNNYAFIDSQNLNLSIQQLGWKLDFAKFRIYLKEKYGVARAFLFIGYVEGNNSLYTVLQEMGYICIFKPTVINKDGTVKGNCDAELVLQAMIEYSRYDKAVVVTGDGDFHCLVTYLISRQKLEALIIPDRFRFSALFKFKAIKSHLRFMNELRQRLSLTI